MLCKFSVLGNSIRKTIISNAYKYALATLEPYNLKAFKSSKSSEFTLEIINLRLQLYGHHAPKENMRKTKACLLSCFEVAFNATKHNGGGK